MSPVQPAVAADLAELVHLIGSTEGCAGATVWSLPWDIGHYWVIKQGGRIVAAGSLQPLDDGRRAEIRGLVVAPAHRGTGLATRLVDHLCDIGRRAGLDVVCMTRKPNFFVRQGFAETAPDWLPPYRVQAEMTEPPRVALQFRREAA